MAQVAAGSNPVTHPNYYPHANRGSCEPQEHGGFNLSEGKNAPASSEMAHFTKYLQKYANIQPRTYWWEFPFYTVIRSLRQKFCLGERPEDLDCITTIEKRGWERHLTYLKRLERFPLDKAEYYLRLKESQGVNSIRGLAKITGEDWSYIAKIIKTIDLPDPIKDFLRRDRGDEGKKRGRDSQYS